MTDRQGFPLDPTAESGLDTGEGVAEPTETSTTPASEPPAFRFSFFDLLRVGVRSLLLQALWNPERMQGQGLAYALRPIARRLEGRSGEAPWLARHFGYFNTNPPLSGCALGVIAQFEAREKIQHDVPGPNLSHLKTALGSGLAAIGDSLFWSTLRPLAAILGILWFLEGSPYGALVFLLLYNSFHLYARFRGVFLGSRAGLGWLNVWTRKRLGRIRNLMQMIGVIASAALVHSVLNIVLSGKGTTAGLWLGFGLVLGLIWGENRRMSPSALGIGIFTIALAWATLGR